MSMSNITAHQASYERKSVKTVGTPPTAPRPAIGLRGDKPVVIIVRRRKKQ